MVILSDYWSTLQISLIPLLEQVVETRLTEKEKRLVAIMDVISVEKRLDHTPQYGRGRKPYDLRSMTRAFIAKAALNLSQTKMLREMLLGSAALRTICGFESRERFPASRCSPAVSPRSLGTSLATRCMKRWCAPTLARVL